MSGSNFRELACADHAIAPDEERRIDFGVVMLARVQVEHEIDQRAFELRARAGETDEAAAAQLRRTLQIEQLQFRAEREMIEDFAGQLRLISPVAHDSIAAWIPADRHALVR